MRVDAQRVCHTNARVSGGGLTTVAMVILEDSGSGRRVEHLYAGLLLQVMYSCLSLFRTTDGSNPDAYDNVLTHQPNMGLQGDNIRSNTVEQIACPWFDPGI